MYKIFAGLLLLAFGGVATASTITYRMEGVVTTASGWDNVSVGDTWSAAYTFQLDAPDFDASDPDVGTYFATSVVYTVGDSGSIIFPVEDGSGPVFQTPEYSAMVQILNDYDGCAPDPYSCPNLWDSLQFSTPNGSSAYLDDKAIIFSSVVMNDKSGSLFSGIDADALPLNISHDDFDTASMSISASGASLSGSVTSVSMVPIPAAVWLFGSALAGLGWLRRKQTV